MHFNFDVVMIPLQLIIVFFTIYYFVVSWFGLFGKMKENKTVSGKKYFRADRLRSQRTAGHRPAGRKPEAAELLGKAVRHFCSGRQLRG